MPFQLLNVGKIYLSTPLNVYDNVGNFCICKGTNFGEIIDVKTRTYKCLILYDSFAYDRYWSKSCRYSLFHHTCTHGIQFAPESGLLWHASPWNAPISEQSIQGEACPLSEPDSGLTMPNSMFMCDEYPHVYHMQNYCNVQKTICMWKFF